MTRTIASTTIRPDILDVPRTRSENVIGTSVIAPDVGYYSDQGPVTEFHLNEHDFDVDSLVDAVRQVRFADRPVAVPIAVREQQRRELAEAHASIYDSVLR